MATVDRCGGHPGTSCAERANEAGIAFLGRLGLLAAALFGSLTSVIPDLITTVAAIVGVAGMIYGVATGILIVVNREPDE